MNNVSDYFGSMVFDDFTMKEKLPKATYKEYHQCLYDNKSLSPECADVIANSMKDWALLKGATHYTHWFQPMTGITAEKHEAFISPNKDARVIMEFSGKELIQGEPDASSFPSGGLRATFEARGYTAWDPTSYAFIKDGVLCIPTIFCSYNGESLDKKTPLLKSQEVIDRQARRVLKLFGHDVHRVNTTVGPEQEYFLIERELYFKRKDLVYTGRTLFGNKPAKTQELDDHYFGVVKPRVLAFMKDLNEELWKLGVLAKTQHNEVAPAQHELAPIFSLVNVAADHNQLTMEILKKTASKHGFACLLHEKPFDGVNGSGKHNNWSIATDSGINLLAPGKTPSENAQFLLFLCAVIKAVDEYQDLLRISVSSAGNDHRLGANEAPPAILSVFLGDELNAILEAIEQGTPYDERKQETMKIGIHTLPKFKQDTTDRNRTSPFAFTGNKFEFRMLGSAKDIACTNVMLNTAVAEELCQFADKLEAASDFNSALHTLIKQTIHEHKRIIFNGDGYTQEWVKEAQHRGLLNLRTTADALPCYIKEKNIALFEKHKVYTRVEIQARYEIGLSNYNQVISIESQTMSRLAKTQILPAVMRYTKDISDAVLQKKAVCAELDTSGEEQLIRELSEYTSELIKGYHTLDEKIEAIHTIQDSQKMADFNRDEILPAMAQLRKAADKLECIVAKAYWPYPTYGDLLYSF